MRWEPHDSPWQGPLVVALLLSAAFLGVPLVHSFAWIFTCRWR